MSAPPLLLPLLPPLLLLLLLPAIVCPLLNHAITTTGNGDAAQSTFPLGWQLDRDGLLVPDSNGANLTGSWQLFVDDELIHTRSADVVRAYGQFTKYPGNPVMNDAGLYGTVLRAADGAFRMWHECHAPGNCFANSSDGIRFESPPLGLVANSMTNESSVLIARIADSDPYHPLGRKCTAQQAILGKYPHTQSAYPGCSDSQPSVLYTPWLSTSRWQMFNYNYGHPDGCDGIDPCNGRDNTSCVPVHPTACFGNGYYRATSTDGIHFTDDVAHNPVLPCSISHNSTGDVSSWVYDYHKAEYLSSIKLQMPVLTQANWTGARRAVGMTSTPDPTVWPQPVPALLPDEVDDLWAATGTAQAAGNRTEFYGLSAFAYESQYIGMLWVCHFAAPYDGTTEVQLVTSRDGKKWRRAEPRDGVRPTLLARGPTAWDGMMVFTATQPLVVDGRLHLYYQGNSCSHQRSVCLLEASRPSDIGLATLRRDGWAFLAHARDRSTVGVVITAPIPADSFRKGGKGGRLRLNYRAGLGGSLRAAVLDAETGVAVAGRTIQVCKPLTADDTNATVTWDKNGSIAAGPGSGAMTAVASVQIRFELVGEVELYSYSIKTDDGMGGVVGLAAPRQQPVGSLLPVAIVCVAAAVNCLGINSMSATWSELLMKNACEHRSLTYPSTECDRDVDAQADASERLAAFNFAYHIPNLLSVAGLSVVADTYGRRSALLISMALQAMVPLAIFLIPATGKYCVGHTCIDGYQLLSGVIFACSFSGGWTGMFAVMMTVIADVSASWSDRWRTLALMALEAIASIGSMCGPVLGATIARKVHLRQSFLATAVIMLASMLVICGLPETLPQRKQWSWKKANIVNQILVLGEHRAFICLAIGYCCLTISGVSSINNLYLIRVVQFDTMQLAEMASTMSFVNVLGMMLGLPLLQRIGLDNRQLLILAASSGALGIALWACLGLLPILQATVWYPWALQLVGQPGSGIVGTVMYPCLRATIALVCASGEVESTVVIALGSFGAEQSVVGLLSSAIGPLLYGATEGLGSGDGFPDTGSGSSSAEDGEDGVGWGVAVIYMVGTGMSLLSIAVMCCLPSPEALERKAMLQAKNQQRLLSSSTPSLQGEGGNKRGGLLARGGPEEPLLGLLSPRVVERVDALFETPPQAHEKFTDHQNREIFLSPPAPAPQTRV